ncbi:class I SAM-dependent methyltransferase [Magnetococcus sp. PR-3]|uniref:class I SAM-dependent methyltransferase n=1 Tax=Magnetococcus sp. PR-3 TaxID=3120355 RepID=UPI002FCE5E4D
MFDPIIEALISIHQDLPRKGPGSDELVRRMIQHLMPLLPTHPEMADMGCGNGHAARMLAGMLKGHVTAIDFAPPFIQELQVWLAEHALQNHITPQVGDMLASGLAANSCDLIWSEGAAYSVGVEQALQNWFELLKPGGFVVYSDCCWLTTEPSAPATAFWQENYPDMCSVGESITRAEALGYRFCSAEKLPSQTWWTSYYDPLKKRLDQLSEQADSNAVLAEVIAESYREQALFEQHHKEYGYIFFIVQKP